MKRKTADIAAGAVVGGILLLGILSVIQLQLTGGPMRGEMGSMPAIALLGPFLMSLVSASIIGGVYLFARSQLFTTQTDETDETTETGGPSEPDTDTTASPETAATADREDHAHILAVLPDDERRILEPVLESPGLTQIKVRDRSDFSKSKVSQTITDLEERGLLYRESQGRTYRVYPADDLDERL